MDKRELRRRYLALRGSRPEEMLRTAGERICEKVLRLPEIGRGKTVMTYVSFGGEPDTHMLIERLIKMGKMVCAPRCDAEAAEMEAFAVSGMASLEPGAYDILEPKPERAVPPEKIDCILVPGCVFGRNFHRIGYGKGYYDKYLPSAARAVKIGLCYEFCLTKRLEAEEFDVPVDLIVTEKGVLRRNEHPVF